MDYTVFFQKTLTDLGYDVVGVWNAFDPPHNHHIRIACYQFLCECEFIEHWDRFYPLVLTAQLKTCLFGIVC
jgi:hypothetical protein